MKLKLFNLTTAFLAASGLLVPAQVAFGRSLTGQINLAEAQHLVCVKEGQHLLCDIEKSEKRDGASDLAQPAKGDRLGVQNQKAVKDDKAPETHKASTGTLVPQVTSEQQERIANLLLVFIYLVLPCGLGLGIFLYNRYSLYRTTLIQKQIELLERLWQHGSDNDATSDTSTRS